MQSQITVLHFKPMPVMAGSLRAQHFRDTPEALMVGLRTSRASHELRARPSTRYWMWRDEQILESHYPSETPVADIATALGRSISSVRAKARALGLRRPRGGVRHLDPDLRERRRRKLHLDLAKKASAPEGLIARTASNRVIWTDDALLYLGELWKRLYSASAIGRHLGLPAGRVSMAANRVGLPDRTGLKLRKRMHKDPLSISACPAVDSAMESAFDKATNRVFFRHPRDRAKIHYSKAGREVLARRACGTMH